MNMLILILNEYANPNIEWIY